MNLASPAGSVSVMSEMRMGDSEASADVSRYQPRPLFAELDAAHDQRIDGNLVSASRLASQVRSLTPDVQGLKRVPNDSCSGAHEYAVSEAAPERLHYEGQRDEKQGRPCDNLDEPTPHRPYSTLPTPPAAPRATACAPTRCRSRSSASAPRPSCRRSCTSLAAPFAR